MAFGRFERSAGATPLSEINVTPLVDVMLVLVVLFILAAPLLASSIRLELPRAGAVQGTSAAPALLLSLDAQGQAYIDTQSLSQEALAQHLKHIAALQPDTEIQLRADASVPYGRVVQVMDAAHAAGLQRIGFVTQPPGH